MIIIEKPPLNEELLVHFGVRGMKWGQRKDRAQAKIKEAVGNISTKQKIEATAAIGAAATIGVLAATGNLKAAASGSGKLALSGAQAGGKVLLKGGGLVLKGAAQGTKFIVGGAAKLAGRGISAGWRGVMGPGQKEVNAIAEKSGKKSLKSLLRFRRKGEGPAKNVLKKSGRKTLRSLFGMKPKGVTAPTKLYPTTSILDKKKSDSPGRLSSTLSRWRPRDVDG